MTVPEVIWDKWQMQLRFLPVFLLGRYIVEQEQQGAERAKYGAKVLDSLSSYLTEEYGRGFSRSNVAGMRQFYMAYKDRENEIIQSGIGQFEQAFGIVQSGIGQLEMAYKKIPFKLSWTYYQILILWRYAGFSCVCGSNIWRFREP